ncbi:MAG: hypothetical protein AB7E70_14255 [Hyphomicrobiaceae bacterium]
MRSWLAILLAAVTFLIGAFRADSYVRGRARIGGIRIACDILDTGVRQGYFTTAQRDKIIDRLDRKLDALGKKGDKPAKADHTMRDLFKGCARFATGGAPARK